jgi:hypothetical protein
MKHTAKYCSLRETINFFISEANLPDSVFLRFWHLGYRGLEELGMDVTETVKTRILKVNDNKTVDLPGDYMQWSKVGVLNSAGEVATLRYNRNLTGYAATDVDRISLTARTDSDSSASVLDFRNYAFDGQYCNLFGVPGGLQNLGEFKVDDVQGVVLLDSQFSYTEIVLEYIASPVSDDEFLFPVQAREALISYIRWKSIQSVRNIPANKIEQNRLEYYNQKRLARARLNPVRLTTANDVIRLNSRIGIKS